MYLNLLKSVPKVKCPSGSDKEVEFSVRLRERKVEVGPFTRAGERKIEDDLSPNFGERKEIEGNRPSQVAVVARNAPRRKAEMIGPYDLIVSMIMVNDKAV